MSDMQIDYTIQEIYLTRYMEHVAHRMRLTKIALTAKFVHGGASLRPRDHGNFEGLRQNGEGGVEG